MLRTVPETVTLTVPEMTITPDQEITLGGPGTVTPPPTNFQPVTRLTETFDREQFTELPRVIVCGVHESNGGGPWPCTPIPGFGVLAPVFPVPPV
jgi:hypothetical protein